MELQGTQTANGARILVIDQACDNDQLLVSLSKNEAKWLSPVGWTDQQKVTLLDCRADGETTQIDIPAEFAKDIKSGDVLVLRCSELDIEKEIIWESSEIETRELDAAAPVATGLAGGLLSRFKTTKTEPTKSIKSETELRADEAERAAENFKAKMEAATAAKEEAQRKALNAAREAEAALKMEAERIAEMERAAKAFEEAERLKQDELRRLDEERRLEEARLAEEARRIEEARKREIAAKKEADRKAALKRYEAALDITRDEELRLKDRLKGLKKQAKLNAENIAVQTEDLESRRNYLIVTEEAAEKRGKSYEKSALSLDGVSAELSIVQTQLDTLDADRQSLSIRLVQADTDYQHAQKEAEAAIALAETKRAELDNLRRDETDLSSRVSSTSEKLASQSLLAAQAAEKTQKLLKKSENAQAELAQAKIEIESLETSLKAQAESDQALRLETEATQQAIEDSQARELMHRDAIDHLEAGGDPDAITDVSIEPRNYEAEIAAAVENSGAPKASPLADNAEAGLFKRVRRSFSREKDAKISIDIEDVVLDAADIKSDPVILSGVDDAPSFARRHGSSLMVLGAVIGGLAILGGGMALNKTTSPELEVKSTTTAPTQVASAVTRVDLPKPVDLQESAAAKAAPEDIQRPEIEIQPFEKVNLPDVGISEDEIKSEGSDVKTPEVVVTPEPKELITPTEATETPQEVKMAEVIDPTGFAFELPDMMPLNRPDPVSVKKVKPAPIAVKAKKTVATKPAPITKIEPKSEPKDSAKTIETNVDVIAPKAAVPAEAEVTVNYPELTKDIQSRLSGLGFYNGDINGIQTPDTKEAIASFKTLFDMGADSKINAELLMELKRAERDQTAARLAQEASEAEAEAATKLAESAPVIQFYDTVQAVPTQPVITDTLPAASAIVPNNNPVPANVTPEAEPVKVASLPTITEAAPTPVAQDVIVEAKALRTASAEYPAAAQRRNYYVNVSIVVAYDIDISGKAANIRIESNDHEGRYNAAFEKEAMNAIKRLRFEPKTVNGVAVISEGKQKRIVFRAE